MFDKKKQLEKPPETQAAAAPSGPQARVFTMPERYRHGAEGKMHEPEVKKKPQPVIEVKAPMAPKAPVSLPPPPPRPKVSGKKASSTKMIVIIGLAVLVVLSLGGWFALTLVAEPEPVVVPQVVEKEVVKVVPDVKDEPKEVPDQDEEIDSVEDPFEVEVTPGKDSDSDGLSDTEEEVVYKTNPRLPDTDSDGFLDGNEVFHRYNPGGTAPGTLLGAGLVLLYDGQAGLELFQFSYPTVFEITEDEGLGPVFDATTGEGFRIAYASKSPQVDLVDWIESEIGLENYVEDTTKTGLPLVQSENLLVAYVDIGTAVLSFTYDTGIKARVDYLQTMKMMINSVELTGQIAFPEELDIPGQADTQEDLGEDASTSEPVL